ncbi:MAG TPA: hypothetical protein ENG33_04650 [Chloroflexi bacterium]|nr:hypothetical protein [Chloroflexota bacterium]
MMAKAKKVMLIGIDAASPELVELFIREGIMPNTARLVEKGVFGTILPPYPTITTSNWAVIATGAWPATTGITSFTVQKVGDPLDIQRNGFDSRLCEAEFLWEAAERAGKRSILMKYWGSWPPSIKEGIQVEGAGVSLANDDVIKDLILLELSGEHFFTTGDCPKGRPIKDRGVCQKVKMRPAYGWANLPWEPGECREITLTFRLFSGTEKTYYGLVRSSEVIICRSRDYETRLTALGPGEWGDWVIDDFPTDEGLKKGAIWFRLLRLSENELALWTPPIYPVNGFTYPPEIGPELVQKVGPFTPKIWAGLVEGWIDDVTFYEWYDYHNRWLAEASVYLMGNNPWDLFFLVCHAPDHAQHLYLSKFDPQTAEWRQNHNWFPHLPSTEAAREMLPKHYESVDRMVGKLLEAADEETVVLVVSDHGAVASLDEVHVNDVLEQKGLVFYKSKEGSRPQVDWARTKAYKTRPGHIYVNLKGRDPDGIVEPGGEYEEVRDQVIEALYDYVHPETGKRAFSMVIKREDAKPLGLWGEKVGDIIYAVRPEFVGHEHGPILPTARYGLSSVSSVLIMAGPGVKKGVRLERLHWLTDIAPTISYILDIPVPRQAEGAVIYEALEP